MADVTFPPWGSVLFREEIKYISLRGGRGSGKSVSTAKALLIRGARKPLRVLCGREVQKSLKDSVYAQLQDEIKALGLEGFYSSTQSEIRGINGTVFLFTGFSDQSADAIKSYANVDVVWIEEAATISEKSWQALLPTIRKDTAQFIFTWNPRLTDDSTWQRFVVNKPDSCVDLVINYPDNPWFPKTLDELREHDKGTLSEAVYRNIWLGEPLSSLEGSVYEHEIASAYNEGRVRPLVVDSNLSTHAVFDLGIADDTAIIVVQSSANEVRCIDYLEGNRLPIASYSEMLREKGYSKAKIWLPHDGRASSLQTGMTMEEVVKGMGWTVGITPNIGIEAGILAVREMAKTTYFDSVKCKPLLEHVRRYRRNRLGSLIHDEHSHSADALRYVAVNRPSLKHSTWGNAGYSGKINYGKLVIS